ncbi:MAG: nuclear transport factor 2 family protein [Spirochaetes bacterium]|nr:nuclear transport factor 2 family protein [Spirochaetota bacterium]
MKTQKERIKKIIESAYIIGIHGSQDEQLIRQGFHQDFQMVVKKGDTIESVNIDEWLKRLVVMKKDNPQLWKSPTQHTFENIDVTGNTASVKLNVYKGNIHFSTDYMLLYHFNQGWQIVAKIFNVPQ